MACASWRASCALTVNLSIFMVANLTQRRVVARRMPPSCRRKLTIAGCQVGQGSAHGTLGVRTGAQRGGVLRPAHDGHVGTGHFKNVRGTLEFDPEAPQKSSVEAFLDAPRIWTGEAQRDDHLRSPDFLDAERHPLITF